MDDDLLKITTDFIFSRLAEVGGDPLKLPEMQRPVPIVYGVQGMIDNGGLQYLFESDSPTFTPYDEFVKAYRMVGADGAADKLEQAVAMFPFERPECNEPGRLQFLESLAEDSEFNSLSDELCGDASVWVSLDGYVLEHAAEIGAGLDGKRCVQ